MNTVYVLSTPLKSVQQGQDVPKKNQNIFAAEERVTMGKSKKDATSCKTLKKLETATEIKDRTAILHALHKNKE